MCIRTTPIQQKCIVGNLFPILSATIRIIFRFSIKNKKKTTNHANALLKAKRKSSVCSKIDDTVKLMSLMSKVKVSDVGSEFHG